MASADKLPLRPRELVEVRSAAEILSMLDSYASVDGMPFMPEMARYAGRRFTVVRRVDKICDTISGGGGRRMEATVYFDGLRRDGAGHGRLPGRLLNLLEGSVAASTKAAIKIECLAKAGTHTVCALQGQRVEVWLRIGSPPEVHNA
jgi:hypothetical protein